MNILRLKYPHRDVCYLIRTLIEFQIRTINILIGMHVIELLVNVIYHYPSDECASDAVDSIDHLLDVADRFNLTDTRAQYDRLCDDVNRQLASNQPQLYSLLPDGEEEQEQKTEEESFTSKEMPAPQTETGTESEITIGTQPEPQIETEAEIPRSPSDMLPDSPGSSSPHIASPFNPPVYFYHPVQLPPVTAKTEMSRLSDTHTPHSALQTEGDFPSSSSSSSSSQSSSSSSFTLVDPTNLVSVILLQCNGPAVLHDASFEAPDLAQRIQNILTHYFVSTQDTVEESDRT